jgi:hypothetical protein
MGYDHGTLLAGSRTGLYRTHSATRLAKSFPASGRASAVGIFTEGRYLAVYVPATTRLGPSGHPQKLRPPVGDYTQPSGPSGDDPQRHSSSALLPTMYDGLYLEESETSRSFQEGGWSASEQNVHRRSLGGLGKSIVLLNNKDSY